MMRSKLHRRPALVAVVLAMVLVASSCVAGINLESAKQEDGRLVDLTVTTGAVKSPTHVRVLLPTGYDPSSVTRYPVLYLLHGGAGSYKDWISPGAGDAENLTAGLPLIVVMPEAGQAGWFSNWFNDGAHGQPAWELFHIDQLIPYIDSHYKTVAGRQGRAVAGLSMGGFGAMSYAARHPDLFVSAASFSGADDTNVPSPANVGFFEGISGLDGGAPGAIWGHRATDEVIWRGHNPWDLAENLRGLNLTMRTGNGQPGGPFGGSGGFESVVYPENVSFDQRLTQLGIPHLFDSYGPGAHSWPYWNRDLAEQLPIFMNTFANPPAAPATVDFKAIESPYGAYGWFVGIDRPVVEFSELSNASAAGFTLSGSGTGTVVTAGLYVPGAHYQATIASGSGTTTAPLVANERGQLLLTVPLGPANRFQQYTAAAAAAGGTRVYRTTVTVTPAG